MTHVTQQRMGTSDREFTALGKKEREKSFGRDVGLAVEEERKSTPVSAARNNFGRLWRRRRLDIIGGDEGEDHRVTKIWRRFWDMRPDGMVIGRGDEVCYVLEFKRVIKCPVIKVQ